VRTQPWAFTIWPLGKAESSSFIFVRFILVFKQLKLVNSQWAIVNSSLVIGQLTHYHRLLTDHNACKSKI
jgi:hypothetical protein